jgi:hypothetical protein
MRAQSHVVGVALLLGVSVLALAGLTAGLGAVVDGHASEADASRVATALDDALDPVETTGRQVGHVRFSDGRLRTVERDLRVLDDSGVVESVAVGGLVYESGTKRVAYVGDGILRGTRGEGWLVDAPPVVGSEGGDVLLVSAARLNASDTALAGGGRATLRTRVTHDRRRLGTGQYRVAIETETPGPLARQFRQRGASTTTRDLDGDGVPSVVARFGGTRTAYLVVHDMRLEVGR